MVGKASSHAPGAPAYWADACAHLIRRDRILRKLIPVHADQCLRPLADPFQTLVRILVGQQASIERGHKLWLRLMAVCEDELSPACVRALTETQLREAGLPARKSRYVRDASHFFAQSDWMDPAWWQAQENAAVMARLCEIRGVGRWSADMFLIFFLGRPDILPLDDTGLLKAISHHYFSGEPVSRFEAREVSQAWSPWRTVASWYLWRSTGTTAVEY